MKIPMVFKKFTALFTICFAFLLMLPCAGFAEDNHRFRQNFPGIV